MSAKLEIKIATLVETECCDLESLIADCALGFNSVGICMNADCDNVTSCEVEGLQYCDVCGTETMMSVLELMKSL